MVNKIMDGITLKLQNVFGHEVHADRDIEQDLSPPCFFVVVLAPAQTPRLGSRWFREYSFDVHYFPSQQGYNRELHDIGERLFEELEFVQLLDGDVVRGTSMHYEVVDSVLHFFVNYNVFVKREINRESMETLDVEQRTGGD